MPEQVSTGAKMKCSGQFVPAPMPFQASPPGLIKATTPAGTVMDVAPGVNVPPSFGACKAAANPAVIAAKAAGSPSAPCVYAPMGIWTPGASKVTINKMKALAKDCKLKCATAAGTEEISFIDAGQTKVTVK